jgi:hypothetical protein
MKNLKQLSRNVLGRRISRGVTAGRVALTAVLALAVALAVLPATARAASQQQLPFRCFAQVGVDHVVFGPNSFFLPKTEQGPTRFRENAGPTIVTYPLYHGSSRGRDVRYVITEASVLSVAQTLGVNYAPKLAQATGTAAVQNSSSQVGSGNGIDFPASVDFSPAHILVPGPTGFPPTTAQPGAIGEPGYSPLVQVLFRGKTVVLNAPKSPTPPARQTRSSPSALVPSATGRRTAVTTTRASTTRPLTPPIPVRRRSRTSPTPPVSTPHHQRAAPTPRSWRRTARANR